MFDLVIQMLVQLIQCIPVIFGVYLIFTFISDLLFRRF